MVSDAMRLAVAPHKVDIVDFVDVVNFVEAGNAEPAQHYLEEIPTSECCFSRFPGSGLTSTPSGWADPDSNAVLELKSEVAHGRAS